MLGGPGMAREPAELRQRSTGRWAGIAEMSQWLTRSLRLGR